MDGRGESGIRHAHRQWSDALTRLNANLAAATAGMDAARSAFETTEALATRLWD